MSPVIDPRPVTILSQWWSLQCFRSLFWHVSSVSLFAILWHSTCHRIRMSVNPSLPLIWRTLTMLFSWLCGCIMNISNDSPLLTTHNRRYWGQNSYGAVNPSDTAHWQQPISYYCQVSLFPYHMYLSAYSFSGQRDQHISDSISWRVLLDRQPAIYQPCKRKFSLLFTWTCLIQIIDMQHCWWPCFSWDEPS